MLADYRIVDRSLAAAVALAIGVVADGFLIGRGSARERSTDPFVEVKGPSTLLDQRRSRSAGMPRAIPISRSAACTIAVFRGPMRTTCFCAADSRSRDGSA
jgi:hypothetical protein